MFSDNSSDLFIYCSADNVLISIVQGVEEKLDKTSNNYFAKKTKEAFTLGRDINYHFCQ
jgi:hypothetical protein